MLFKRQQTTFTMDFEWEIFYVHFNFTFYLLCPLPSAVLLEYTLRFGSLAYFWTSTTIILLLTFWFLRWKKVFLYIRDYYYYFLKAPKVYKYERKRKMILIKKLFEDKKFCYNPCGQERFYCFKLFLFAQRMYPE
jgi:hypothetical protein